MSKKDWETDGKRNGEPIFCPVNAYDDCPYCDEFNRCHIADPIKDCDEFAYFYDSWEDWEASNADPEDNVDETGFDPYLGCYTEDC